MRLNVGDLVEQNGVRRVITAVRDTGYSWRYFAPPGEEFVSENSSDPFFDLGWRRPDPEKAAPAGLPPLPEMVDTYETGHYPRGFTTDQMGAYALAAVLAERERCAKVCEARSGKVDPRDPDPCFLEALDCAAAIRKG